MRILYDQIDPKYIKIFNDLPESELKSQTYFQLITETKWRNLEYECEKYLCENLLGDRQAFLLEILRMYDMDYKNSKQSYVEGGISLKGWNV